MSNFHFPLQKVLELRLEAEQRKARVVAEAQRDARAARQAVVDLEALRSAGRDRLTQAHGGGHSVGQLQNLEWVLGRMDRQLAVAHEAVDQADAQVSRCMQEFKKAVQHRQTLDRLKERRREDWNAEERAREQKTMDELALARHVRGAQGAALEGGETR